MQFNSEHKANYESIHIEQIVPGNFNPRKEFDSEYIMELAKSLLRDGQWDPIIVRKRTDCRYELIGADSHQWDSIPLGFWR